MELKCYQYIETNETHFDIDLSAECDKVLPIVWNYRGLFGIIPAASIKNLLQEYEDSLKPRPTQIPVSPIHTIHGGTAYKIQPALAKLLVGSAS